MSTKKEQNQVVKEVVHPRLKQVERPCLRCGALMCINGKEECTECEKCGYIDCGEED
jgi:ribosomal protein S27AE